MPAPCATPPNTEDAEVRDKEDDEDDDDEQSEFIGEYLSDVHVRLVRARFGV